MGTLYVVPRATNVVKLPLGIVTSAASRRISAVPGSASTACRITYHMYVRPSVRVSQNSFRLLASYNRVIVDFQDDVQRIPSPTS